MFEYKDEIRATRKGCLGSSDGKMLKQIAELGNVPKSAYKRLAVVKGLLEQNEIPETAAIRMGNETEMQIYEHLKATDERWQSNVRLESKDFSTPNCKLISHPDFLLKDDEHKTLYISECKTTRYTIEQTRSEYASQLFIHYVLGKEKAKELGKGWKVKLSLTHYSTEGLDLNEYNEFDPNRLTIREVRPSTAFFDIRKAMGLVDTFLQDFNEYYEGGVVEERYLPMEVKQQFLAITNVLAEIKAKEKQVDEFKQRLYAFMCEKNIRNIVGDAFTITCVDATESKSFDAKRYVEDLKKEHPRKAYKIIDKYTKTTQKRGYAKILIREDDAKG